MVTSQTKCVLFKCWNSHNMPAGALTVLAQCIRTMRPWCIDESHTKEHLLHDVTCSNLGWSVYHIVSNQSIFICIQGRAKAVPRKLILEPCMPHLLDARTQAPTLVGSNNNEDDMLSAMICSYRTGHTAQTTITWGRNLRGNTETLARHSV